MGLKQLSLNRAGTFRAPQETKAEKFRGIDGSVQLTSLPFPAPARPASGLIQGRKLQA